MNCHEEKSMIPPGKYFFLPFLPATPSSPSRTLEGFFELTWRQGSSTPVEHCCRNYRDARAPSGLSMRILWSPYDLPNILEQNLIGICDFASFGKIFTKQNWLLGGHLRVFDAQLQSHFGWVKIFLNNPNFLPTQIFSQFF